MIISDNKKLIFVHIPKSAGSSVINIIRHFNNNRLINLLKSKYSKLNVQNFDHLTMNEISMFIDTTKYKKFTVVRNPWDWHVSWFHFIKKHYIHHFPDIKNYNFKEYVKWLDDVRIGKKITIKDYIYHCNMQQIDWVIDDNRKIIVDDIIKMEEISKLSNFLKKFDITVNDIPHSNKGQHLHYKDYYDDEMYDIIYKKHKEDIDNFGYIF